MINFLFQIHVSLVNLLAHLFGMDHPQIDFLRPSISELLQNSISICLLVTATAFTEISILCLLVMAIYLPIRICVRHVSAKRTA